MEGFAIFEERHFYACPSCGRYGIFLPGARYKGRYCPICGGLLERRDPGMAGAIKHL